MASEHQMDKRLRWMKENVEGAYYAKHEHNPNCPPDHVDPTGYCTNSGTVIIVCCYMEGLGKVLKRGNGNNTERFNEFVKRCMQEFLTQTKAQGVSFYRAFRSGLVHGYPTLDYKWIRKGSTGKYWYQFDGKPTLNIDQFVSAFIDGLAKFKQMAVVESYLRDDFMRYITLEPQPPQRRKLRPRARHK